jgi:tetratricopeptide (TPR) repeat protein
MSKASKPSVEELYWAANALLAAGKVDENRRVCRQLLQVYEGSGDAEFAFRAAYAYVPAPVPESEIRRLVAAAEAVTGTFPGNERVLAACLYRAGEFEKAMKTLDEAHRTFAPGAWDHCFLAMLHSKLGNDEEANKALATARDRYQQELEVGGPWCLNVETEALLAEASSLIDGMPRVTAE